MDRTTVAAHAAYRVQDCDLLRRAQLRLRMRYGIQMTFRRVRRA